MYPLTKDRAKPLLPVAGKPIVGHLVDQLESTGSFDEIVVVSNARFHTQFVEWGDRRVIVLNDGATTEKTRRGAVGDLAWALEHRVMHGPLLVAAGDNLFRDSLEAFVADYEANPRNLILRYREPDRDELKRTGVAEIEPNGRLVRLEEKPVNPTTEWACPALYILEADALDELGTYVEEKLGADALGSFIAWLAPRVPLFTHEMRGSRLDVGELEGYARAETWLTNGG
ncbi:MAG: hypothetical protein BMS9Abin37_2948 [Acidobacteriota bacterium]|nr:MAG: hypothetical protein BMS9Abin37_2948 [Acidobacteriota bacterium]